LKDFHLFHQLKETGHVPPNFNNPNYFIPIIIIKIKIAIDFIVAEEVTAWALFISKKESGTLKEYS
jgi:hypothetical protein